MALNTDPLLSSTGPLEHKNDVRKTDYDTSKVVVIQPDRSEDEPSQNRGRVAGWFVDLDTAAVKNIAQSLWPMVCIH